MNPKPNPRKIKESLAGFESKLRSKAELEKQLGDVLAECVRDPNLRTFGYCYQLLGTLRAFTTSKDRIDFVTGEVEALAWFTGAE